MSECLDGSETEQIRFLESLLAAPPELSVVMDITAKGVMTVLRVDGVVLEVPEGGELVYRTVVGITESQLGLRVPLTQSLSGAALLARKMLVCDDSEFDPRVNLQACRSVGLRSMAVVPLFLDEDQVLILKALCLRPGAFTDDRISLLRALTVGILGALRTASRWQVQRDQITRLHEQVSFDSLTGIGNRSMFYDNLRSAFALQTRIQTPFAAVMLDLDGLKFVNDTYGHAAGDYLLRSFATRLRDRFRKTDTVARLGGDEFGVLMSPFLQTTGLQETVQKLIAEVEGELEFAGIKLNLRTSFGVALAPRDGDKLEQLLGEADRRLYIHKRNRKLGQVASR